LKAIVCHEYGSPDNLTLDERATPVPGNGEILIEVKAAGINFPDLLTIEGKYQVRPPLPFVPGNELAGIVTAVGEGVISVAVGDEIIAMSDTGAFAERCVVSEQKVLAKGSKMSFEQAAGMAITYGTSYYALKQKAALQAGETVLVLGAAGGVGIAAIQLAKLLGATVIAAASTDEKLDFASQAGADRRINYSEEDLKDRVKSLTDGQGVDVVYDPVGGELSEQALRATAWNGRFLVIGFASGTIPKIPLNLALLKGVSIVGVFWGSWASRFPNESAGNFGELIEMIENAKFAPLVTDVYPLDRYAEAFRCISERRARGKVVLSMA